MSGGAMVAVAAVGIVGAPTIVGVTWRRRSFPKFARRLLVVISICNLLPLWMAMEAPRVLKESVGRFDDLMYGIVGLGTLSLVGTVVVSGLGLAAERFLQLRHNRTTHDHGPAQ